MKHNFQVPVTFNGHVSVEIDDSVPEDRREDLAAKIAICKVVAVVENPDSPDEYACAEYAQEFDLDDETAGKEWDASSAESVCGDWQEDDPGLPSIFNSAL